MNWKFGRFEVSKWWLFIAISVAMVLATGYGAYATDQATFWVGLLGGVCSGILILIVDKWLDRSELRFLVNRDGIEGATSGREDASYYGRLISSAKNEIAFLGRNGSRLLKDFADADSKMPEKQLLIAAIRRGVRVRFLVAAAGSDAASVNDAEAFKVALDKLRGAVGATGIDVKTYTFPPSFSYFRADKVVVFGPNFPNRKSRHTTSIIADSGSQAATEYTELFDFVWGHHESMDA